MTTYMTSLTTFNVKVTPRKGGESVILQGYYRGNKLVVNLSIIGPGLPTNYLFHKLEGVWKNLEYGLTAEIVKGDDYS